MRKLYPQVSLYTYVKCKKPSADDYVSLSSTDVTRIIQNKYLPSAL